MNFAEYSLDTQLLLAFSAARKGDEGVGATDRRILEALSKKWRDFGHVRRATQMDKGQLSRALDDLAERKLVFSRTEHQRRQVRLSAAGDKARVAALAARAKTDAALLRNLTSAEAEVLPSILHKLASC